MTLGVKAPVYNLHAQDPWRGVTWHDEDSGVCWLLAASTHDYDLFVERAKNGKLEPTVVDYADLEVSRNPATHDSSVEHFLELATADAGELYARAWEAPGQEVRGCLAHTIDVSMFVEVIVIDAIDCHEMYVALSMPPKAGFQLPDDVIVVCAQKLMPEAVFDDIDWYHDTFPRPGGARSDEVVLRWRVP